MSLDAENKLFKVEERHEDDEWLGDPDCAGCHWRCEPCSPEHEHPVRPEKDSRY